MFPYPSGKIHMGHVRNYSIGDAIARKKRMEGFNVLHPIGWDSFGMPAENAAISAKSHPYKWTVSNIETMREQFKALGLSYDWGREVATSHPGYYKWTQWIFARMMDEGYAYQKKIVRQLVRGVQYGAGQRTGSRWRMLAMRKQGYATGAGELVP